MKLRTQILALGLSGALFACIVGSIGLVSTQMVQADVTSAIQASHALQASQTVDMMHDAIRADAQLAMLGATESRPERIAQAASGLKEHADTMHEQLAKLQALPLSKDSQQALAAAQPVVKSYIDAAIEVVRQTQTSSDKDSIQGPRQVLQVVFTDLDGKLAAMSASIEKAGEVQQAQAKAGVEHAATSIGIALLLAASSMTALSLWMAAHMRRPMAAAVEAAERLAGGDLTVDVPSGGNDETKQVLGSLKDMRDGFARIVHEVKSNAESVATAAEQIALGNNDLSGRTEQQASALDETAVSMEQRGSTVKHNADNARQANPLAQGASTVAIRGGAVVDQVITTMKGINDSSKQIAEIISVIDGIAFQTNILALNAAVEAARAGEQGRGFAVVASEVRNLAQRSAEAAKEIKCLITASVELGTTLVDRAGVTMTELVCSIKRVTDLMGEISAASTEQSQGVAQVGEAVSPMDHVTQQNVALVEESAAAAESLKVQAQQLVQAVAVFKLSQAQGYQTEPAALSSIAEQRGPNRATNVTRPRFATKAASAARKQPTPVSRDHDA